MSDLKEKIRGAEIAAATEESPIAALFKQSNPVIVGSSSSAPTPAPNQSSQFRDLPADALEEMEQPFRICEDYIQELEESITERGVIVRIIVRPHPDKPGIYQIIDGRHRRRAAMRKGYTLLPCEIRQLDDAQAALLVIETTLRQRPGLLPSEKAKAYRKRLELLSHQGKRTCAQSGHKSVETVAEEVDESRNQIKRYIRLTYLVSELLEAVDNEYLGFGAGVALSYLSTESQAVVYQYFFVDHKQKIGGDLADALRFAGEKGPITEELISRLLSPAVKAKPKPLRKVAVNMKPIRSFFPAEASAKEIEKQIIEILTEYFDGRKEKR